MVYKVIRYQKIGHVMVIDVIDAVMGQEKIVQLSDELTELCDELLWDEETRVIVLSGTALSKNPEEQEAQFFSISEPIAKLDKPVIAAIHGDAIGQGLELVLASDIRIASEASHFGLTHIRAGHIPWDGGTQRLSRLVGKSKALQMILTGEIIDAKEAYRIGLIHKLTPSGEIMTVVMDVAKEMASKAPIALRYTKEAIQKGMDMTLEQGLRLEADLYLLLHTTNDRMEGIKSFREKKTPRFEGQ